MVLGPKGGVAGGVTAAVTASAARPYDAAWQGYKASYYTSSNSTEAWAVSYFYGWRSSVGVTHAITVCGERDPQRFCNFADNPSSSTWWTWRSGNSVSRSPNVASSESTNVVLSEVRMRRHAELNLVARQGDQLVQRMAAGIDAWADAAAGGAQAYLSAQTTQLLACAH